MRPLLLRGPALERLQSAVETARAAGADQAEAVLMTDNSAVTRYAGDRIHQNVGEENAELRVRAAVGRRVAVAASNRLGPEGIRETAERAVAMARLTPEDEHFAGLPGQPSSGYVDQTTYYEATAELDADDRAAGVAEVLGTLGTGGATGYGVVTNGVAELAVANSLGLHAYQSFTDAWVSVVAERPQNAGSVTGYATEAGRDWVPLDPAAVAARALRKTDPLPRVEVDPGRYMVVLEQEAVAELLGFLTYYTVNGLAFVEGRSLFAGRLGEARFPAWITLRDDPTDPRGANVSFDFEGEPKAPLALIREGRIESAAFDRATGRRAGRPSTGHALPAPNTYGPMPTNLVLAPGDGTLDDLVSQVDRGLLVTRFHYVNAVDPARTILTGMTRDGTFLIEEGEVVARTQELRWVESIDAVLQHTIALGGDLRLISEGPGYDLRFMTGSLVPPLLVEGFTVTGSASESAP